MVCCAHKRNEFYIKYGEGILGPYFCMYCVPKFADSSSGVSAFEQLMLRVV